MPPSTCAAAHRRTCAERAHRVGAAGPRRRSGSPRASRPHASRCGCTQLVSVRCAAIRRRRCAPVETRCSDDGRAARRHSGMPTGFARGMRPARCRIHIEDTGGLLRIAVTHNRPDVLQLLLDFGFDPDERTRFGEGDESAVTWGMALQHCASTGQIRDGRDAPSAWSRSQRRHLRQRRSGVLRLRPQKTGRCSRCCRDMAAFPTRRPRDSSGRRISRRKMLSGEAPYRMDGVGGETVAEQLLWGAACGGDPEIVRMALERVDWPRDDPRWFDGAGTAAANVDARSIRRRSAARRLSRLLPPRARTLRSQPAWASDRRAAVRIDDAAQHRRAWRHDARKSESPSQPRSLTEAAAWTSAITC